MTWNSRRSSRAAAPRKKARVSFRMLALMLTAVARDTLGWTVRNSASLRLATKSPGCERRLKARSTKAETCSRLRCQRPSDRSRMASTLMMLAPPAAMAGLTLSSTSRNAAEVKRSMIGHPQEGAAFNRAISAEPSCARSRMVSKLGPHLRSARLDQGQVRGAHDLGEQVVHGVAQVRDAHGRRGAHAAASRGAEASTCPASSTSAPSRKGLTRPASAPTWRAKLRKSSGPTR